MTTTIYLIRHGEVYNPKGILYGRMPKFGLSQHGRKEIQQTAQFLKNKQIDVIYSSPMLRAKQTAAIISAETGIQNIYISKYLTEVKTSFQGRLFTELGHEQKNIYFSPERLPSDETFEQMNKRLHTFLQIVIKKHAGKHIVLVYHGDPIMLLRGTLSGLPVAYPTIRNGNGFAYVQHGEVVSLEINDTNKINIKNVFKPSI